MILVCSEIENGWVTMQFGKGDPSTDQLVEVFRNGVITTEYTFESIRKRANVPYKDDSASTAEEKTDTSAAAAAATDA